MSHVRFRGNAVRERREALELTQGKLGQLSGYSKRTIERIETGVRVKTQTARDVAMALGSHLEDLCVCEPLARPHSGSNTPSKGSCHPYIATPDYISADPCGTAKVVAIVGAGFSGIVSAIRILELARERFKVVLFQEKCWGHVGGLAYGGPTTRWEHLLNIQAGRISAFREHSLDFLSWTNSPETERSVWPREYRERPFVASSAVPRRVYGQYLENRLADAAEQSSALFNVVVGEVVKVTENSATATVHCVENGRATSMEVDQVLLATGHLTPNIPEWANSVVNRAADEANCPRLFETPYDTRLVAHLKTLNASDRVLIAGTALSAYDAVLTLEEAEFRGEIVMCSRHGWLHSTYPTDHRHDFLKLEYRRFFRDVRSATKMRRAIEDSIDYAESIVRRFRLSCPRSIIPERVFKWIEPQVRDFVREASRDEVRRFLRDNHSWLTTHRSCVVAGIAETIFKVIAGPETRIKVVAGEIERASSGNSNQVDVRMKVGGTPRVESFSTIICCAGMNADYTTLKSGLWHQLLETGYAVPHDKTGLGVKVTKYGQLVGKDGRISRLLTAVGTMRQGDEIERNGRLGAFTFSIGTIRNQALITALHVLGRLEDSGPASSDYELNAAVERVSCERKKGQFAGDFDRVVDFVRKSHFMPRLPNREAMVQRSEELVRELATGLDGDPTDALQHAIWTSVRFEAAKQITDIRELADDCRVLRSFGENDPSRSYEKEVCGLELSRIATVLNAHSASLFVYRPHRKVLTPFAQYKRHDDFTETPYGKAVAGNLIRATRRTPELSVPGEWIRAISGAGCCSWFDYTGLQQAATSAKEEAMGKG